LAQWDVSPPVGQEGRIVHGRFFRKLAQLRDHYGTAPGLPFADALSEARLRGLLDELNVFYRERIYTPCVTLWTFLAQVLHPDQSCDAAVARLIAFRVAQGQPPCSADNSSYCQARQRLPEALVERLVRDTGAEVHRQAPASWQKHGRPVKIVDGSTVSMPDTPANEAAFGKPRNQRGVCGFPLARFLVVLCLATGSALEAAIGPWRGKQAGELTLFRGLQDPFSPGDILLGDRLFCTYCDAARLKGKQVDVVFRLHAHRRADFRRGRRLGRGDHVVLWTKPEHCPDWLSAEEFAALPAQLPMREVRVRLAKPNGRVRTLIVVTTLTDPRTFSAEDIAELYRQRWQAELDLRSIKAVMHMDVLRCETPAMVRKEIWMHLLAYNLLRSVMCAAAEEHQVPVRELSFKGAEQLLEAFYLLLLCTHRDHLEPLCTILLKATSQHRVGDRPDRYEPRKRKRAAKPYPRLKLSRAEERKLCA
jgi:DDE family transposase